MSTIDRIRKLVALAGSANENEARNAAVQACKLITEHKVTLTMPGAPAGETFRNVRTGARPTQTAEEVMRNGVPVDLGNFVESFLGKDAAERFRRNSAPAPGAGVRPEPMTAPQDGTCRDCGGEFRRGDRVWYKRGVGAVHTMKCDPDILTRKAPSR